MSIIGIDFGTTKCAVSVVQQSQPVIIRSLDGLDILPSVVAYRHDGEPIIGQMAKQNAVYDPENTVFSVKRFIGQSFSVIRKNLLITPQLIKPWPKDDILLHIPAIGKSLSPIEVAALILSKIKYIAESYLGETVSQAVITGPGCYGYNYIKALHEAGNLAGLHVLCVRKESLAASLAYTFIKKYLNENILLFDLGGGKLELSVQTYGDGITQIRSVGGNPFLGGDDWSQRIIRVALSRFQEMHNYDLALDPVALVRLRDAAEKSRIELSTLTQTALRIPSITRTKKGVQDLELILSRQLFEEITHDMVDSCQKHLDRVIADSGVPIEQIKTLLVVGGATRMTMIKILLDQFRNKNVKVIQCPDDSIAKGAAILGGVYEGVIKDVLPLDVVPLSLGITSGQGGVKILIARYTTIPTRKSVMITLRNTEQSDRYVNIIEGEDTLADNNYCLGQIKYADILPEQCKDGKVELTFDIDAIGIMRIGTRHLESGKTGSWVL